MNTLLLNHKYYKYKNRREKRDRPFLLGDERMISPHKGRFRVSQIYKGTTHKGIDLVGLDDKTIYSTVIGTVEAVRVDTHPTGGLGLYVRIGENGTNHRYYFAHLSQAYVQQGQPVQVGDKIGLEGSTGNATGSHLHYEIRREPNNTTFLDVAAISGIPNLLGTYEQEMNILDNDIKDVSVSIGDTQLQGKLIGSVTYVPLREFLQVIKKELDVTWDKVAGAGVKI